ncbi:MAG: cytoplasmic protein [Deltaproteobacteria bacterium]|nr:cytoplasmic protein [Deltaproteobacteria bacterium]
MKQHQHEFVDTYDGLVGFGLQRDIDEATVQVYLQKFSDDELMKVILPRMRQEDLSAVFDLLSDLLRRHLAEEEYHALFLKD